jgi:hypothetical protein
MLCQLLLIPEGPTANIAIALQRILLIVVDPFVLHPASVAGEDGSALPAAHVRLDPGVRVQVAFHVSLELENFTIFFDAFSIVRTENI